MPPLFFPPGPPPRAGLLTPPTPARKAHRVIGQDISHYRVTARLGAGGMGEVYRATDTKLRRGVALKVLPPAVASDPQRMARFEREAQLLAALNHPNIAAIYGLEDSGATRALVMELVEGPTLADRIAQGAIPFDEALPIARQIAEALEYAHERGIVHRDLKPANVKVKDDGSVRVLDFGLAKALSEDPTNSDIANSPTLTAAATKAGFILGTAAYMSPEQARGKAVDRRSDIWSFGAVLFEMLTGKLAFHGETISDTLAAVIRSEPDWTLLPASVPRSIRTLLLRCLHKDPRQRLQSIGEARIAIENALSGNDSATADSPPSASVHSGRAMKLSHVILASAIGVLLLAGGFVLAKLTKSTTAQTLRVVRFSIAPPRGAFFFLHGAHAMAISPDGTRLVFRINTAEGARLYLRDMSSSEITLIPGTEGAEVPFFSPDGQSVAFVSSGTLKKTALSGGIPVPLADSVANALVAFGERINTSTSRRASLLPLCVCPPRAVHLNQSPKCWRKTRNSVTSAPCSSPAEKHSCLPYGSVEMWTTARSWHKCWPPEKEKSCSPTLLIPGLSLPTISFLAVGQIS